MPARYARQQVWRPPQRQHLRGTNSTPDTIDSFCCAVFGALHGVMSSSCSHHSAGADECIIIHSCVHRNSVSRDTVAGASSPSATGRPADQHGRPAMRGRRPGYTAAPCWGLPSERPPTRQLSAGARTRALRRAQRRVHTSIKPTDSTGLDCKQAHETDVGGPGKPASSSDLCTAASGYLAMHETLF